MSVATGSLDLHQWNGIGGTAVSDMTFLSSYPSSPSETKTVTKAQAATNIRDSYGVRMFGYLVPAVSGNYTFWISSDDNTIFGATLIGILLWARWILPHKAVELWRTTLAYA